MPFIGNQPALSFTSFAKQDFSTSATTSYTLDNPVANANELALFINFVRQEPTTAYSASGTTLTLTSATASSDDMYCVYLGKAVQTVNPPNASVGASQIVDASITSGKLASGVLPANTPAFLAYQSSGQSIAHNTATTVNFQTELFDTNNAFASNTFTVPSGEDGKYLLYFGVSKDNFNTETRFQATLQLNGTSTILQCESGAFSSFGSVNGTTTANLSASNTVKLIIYHNSNSTDFLRAGLGVTYFGAHKLIGV
jgi:hypothetical protein